MLKATGDAPILKKKKWSVEPDKTIHYISTFIRRYLKLDSKESLVSDALVVIVQCDATNV